MAFMIYCPICESVTIHDNIRRCIDCKSRKNEEKIKQDYEKWRSDKATEEQIESLYYMVSRLYYDKMDTPVKY